MGQRNALETENPGENTASRGPTFLGAVRKPEGGKPNRKKDLAQILKRHSDFSKEEGLEEIKRWTKRLPHNTRDAKLQGFCHNSGHKIREHTI